MTGRPGGVLAVGLAQLRHDRTRTALAVLGVALAVLAMTLLAGTGVGVVQTGEEKFDAAGRDLWVTGGPVRLAPGSVGGFENPITDAHATGEAMADRADVATAAPLLFQTVYVGTNNSSLRTIVAVGVPSTGGFQVTEGEGFEADPHYAGGNYTGPMQRVALLDPQAARLLNASVGEELRIGGTLVAARRNGFTVTGLTPTGSRFLGTPTVVLPLSELQEVTDTTGTDPATLITIKVADGADPRAVERELQAAYPRYDVRTNREQLEATLQRQAVVLAGGASLIVIAIVAGMALTINVMLSLLAQQRVAFAALQALGCSTGTLVGITTTQALALGGLGGGLGLALTWPAARGLNRVAVAVTGFENVVRTPGWILAAGLGTAVAMSLLAAVATALRLRRLDPLDALE